MLNMDVMLKEKQRLLIYISHYKPKYKFVIRNEFKNKTPSQKIKKECIWCIIYQTNQF